MISIPPVWQELSWKMGDGFEVLREHHICRYIISLQFSASAMSNGDSIGSHPLLHAQVVMPHVHALAATIHHDNDHRHHHRHHHHHHHHHHHPHPQHQHYHIEIIS
ncbi:hypothetical protein I7I50_10007 [Histoplasma capsulatum G186AR]|uniref:Uncharacterized protein n=1 Tax=Ajellomyces capsulatus TaxID=5037 RepID=A0A8H8D640_AJECA|nr:hypothetical protein I7I52_01245 [Histoplasma capsulatum]QSS68888.1 hypothetical protein I7I50_10007 [Histoplasma capsulatum G186AR]